jgi:hypothetical protein
LAPINKICFENTKPEFNKSKIKINKNIEIFIITE